MKQTLSLDFVSNSFSFRQTTVLGLLFCAIGLVLALMNYERFQAQNAQLQAIQAQINALKPVAKPLNNSSTKQNQAISEAEQKNLDETVRLLITPWHPLLVALEKIESKDVALLSLQPSIKKHQIVLEGQAKHMQAILNYVKQLETLSMLKEVYLEKHEVDDSDPFKPVSFTIVAQWYDESR